MDDDVATINRINFKIVNIINELCEFRHDDAGPRRMSPKSLMLAPRPPPPLSDPIHTRAHIITIQFSDNNLYIFGM